MDEEVEDLDEFFDGIKGRDVAAFEGWVARAEPMIRRSITRFAAKVDTEVVVQSVLFRIWEITPRHRPDGRPDSLLRVALRIARNQCIDEIRRPAPEFMAPADLECLVECADQHHDPDLGLERACESCIKALPDVQRTAILARLSAGGEDDASLARGLGMKVNTFRQNISRARRELASCLGRLGIDVEAFR